MSITLKACKGNASIQIQFLKLFERENRCLDTSQPCTELEIQICKTWWPVKSLVALLGVWMKRPTKTRFVSQLNLNLN